METTNGIAMMIGVHAFETLDQRADLRRALAAARHGFAFHRRQSGPELLGHQAAPGVAAKFARKEALRPSNATRKDRVPRLAKVLRGGSRNRQLLTISGRRRRRCSSSQPIQWSPIALSVGQSIPKLLAHRMHIAQIMALGQEPTGAVFALATVQTTGLDFGQRGRGLG